MSSVIEKFYGEELKKAKEEAFKKAKEEAFKKSYREAINNMCRLFDKLLRENRNDELKRALNDKKFRDKLLREMFSQEKNN